MRGVDVALECLQIIAVALDKRDANLGVGHVEDLERRQRRHLFGALPHIDPHHAGALDRRVGLGADLVLEVLQRLHVRHVKAAAGHLEFPTVIDTADAAFFVAAEKQRGAAVRATMIHDADPAGIIAKRDQLLAEQHQADRHPAARDFRRHQRRDPVFPHQPAHRGARADPRQLNAVVGGRHESSPNASRACAARGAPDYLTSTSQMLGRDAQNPFRRTGCGRYDA